MGTAENVVWKIKTTPTICFAYRANRRGLFVSLQKGLPITWQPLFLVHFIMCIQTKLECDAVQNRLCIVHDRSSTAKVCVMPQMVSPTKKKTDIFVVVTSLTSMV